MIEYEIFCDRVNVEYCQKSKQNAQVPQKYVKWKREKPKCEQMVLL